MIPLQFQQLKIRLGNEHQHQVNVRLALVVSSTAPLTTLYKSLSRYLGNNSARSSDVAGVSSDGFTTAAQPAAIAPVCSSPFSFGRGMHNPEYNAPTAQDSITEN